ncbi:formin-like protein 5 [Suricata suricatta]|uniref:formin-like protein 5 n=1 Tax=Suricata suricatta TaxID=37032 RepID=UPI0011557C31|nr:formin-like protein 5 [Suricata suricatta]
MAACGSSVKMQRKQQPVTGLREAGQQGGAAAERLEHERPTWRQGQWPLWGASTPPPRAYAAVPGLRGPSPAPPPPPALRPPLTGCSGIFSSDTAFKMAAPPPDNPLNRPLQQAPSRRHLVPRPSPPPRRYLHSENRPGRPAAFTSRLQPSPPCQASPPRGAPGRPRRLPGHRATLPQSPPVQGARIRRRSGPATTEAGENHSFPGGFTGGLTVRPVRRSLSWVLAPNVATYRRAAVPPSRRLHPDGVGAALPSSGLRSLPAPGSGPPAARSPCTEEPLAPEPLGGLSAACSPSGPRRRPAGRRQRTGRGPRRLRFEVPAECEGRGEEPPAESRQEGGGWPASAKGPRRGGPESPRRR